MHHDHHDNLYCLLRGRKRLRLYAPSDAPRMRTHGRVRRVHPNGRINYAGDPTAADGRTAHDVLRWRLRRARRARRRAEVALEAAESEARRAAGGGRGVATKKAAVVAAEEALDCAAERCAELLLDAEARADACGGGRGRGRRRRGRRRGGRGAEGGGEEGGEEGGEGGGEEGGEEGGAPPPSFCDVPALPDGEAARRALLRGASELVCEVRGRDALHSVR